MGVTARHNAQRGTQESMEHLTNSAHDTRCWAATLLGAFYLPPTGLPVGRSRESIDRISPLGFGIACACSWNILRSRLGSTHWAYLRRGCCLLGHIQRKSLCYRSRSTPG